MLSNAASHDPGMLAQYNYERIANEFYPTPAKFVRCLAEHFYLPGTHWWEPCAGQGHIALALDELAGTETTCTDLVRYPDHPQRQGFSKRVGIADFLALTSSPKGVDGLATNPPYLTVKVNDPEWEHLAELAKSYGMTGKKISLAELFLRHALALMFPAQGRVAMFLRNEFDCGVKRMDLFKDHPAYVGKIVCTERPRWIEGSTGSPRHSYSWFLFDWDNTEPSQVFYSNPKTAKPLTVQ